MDLSTTEDPSSFPSPSHRPSSPSSSSAIAIPPVGKASRKQPVQYSGFFPPAPLNVKYVSSNFIKNDLQTMAARIAADGTSSNNNKRRKVDDNDDDTMADVQDDDQGDEDSDGKSVAASTIVIHPASTHIRVGLATDLTPVVWPNVLARRNRHGGGTSRQEDKQSGSNSDTQPSEKTPSDNTASTTADTTAGTNSMDTAQADGSHSPHSLDTPIANLRADLRSIMRNMKLRGVSNGRASAANYNATVQPETIPSHNDLEDEWTPDGSSDIEMGERAYKLASLSPKTISTSTTSPWSLFRPIRRGRLDRNTYRNTYKHAADQVLSADISRLFASMISTPRLDLNKHDDTNPAGGKTLYGLGIPRRDFHQYSAILIVPDCFPRDDVRILVNVLLEDLAFSQLIVQQESTAATFGAGISSACVVHLGGQRGSISCVDEGLLLQETRVHLDYGGTDVDDFLFKLLTRANLPYRDCRPEKRISDQLIIQDLKHKMCTLDVTQIGLFIHDFLVRYPSTPTRKYQVRVYDEVILAPMIFFGIGVRCIEFDERTDTSTGTEPNDKNVSDATRALDEEDQAELDAADAEMNVPITQAMMASVKHLMPTQPPPLPTPTPAGSPPAPDAAKELAPPATEHKGSAGPPSRDASLAPGTEQPQQQQPQQPAPTAPTSTATTAALPRRQTIFAHSSRQPLDVALFHSLIASVTAGNASPAVAAERLKKLASNILVIGGTAFIMGVGAAIEARLIQHLEHHFAQQQLASGQATGASSTAPTPTVIPPPRDIDPTLLAWKGMAVLPRLESASEMWYTRAEWDVLGWKGFKDRSLFL